MQNIDLYVTIQNCKTNDLYYYSTIKTAKDINLLPFPTSTVIKDNFLSTWLYYLNLSSINYSIYITRGYKSKKDCKLDGSLSIITKLFYPFFIQQHYSKFLSFKQDLFIKYIPKIFHHEILNQTSSQFYI